MDPQITNLVNILNNPSYAILFLVLVVWSLVWKGFSLWASARNGQKKWFIILLVLNTFGLLEILYLFYFSTRKDKEKPTNV